MGVIIDEVGHILIHCKDIIDGLLGDLFTLQLSSEEISVTVEERWCLSWL